MVFPIAFAVLCCRPLSSDGQLHVSRTLKSKEHDRYSVVLESVSGDTKNRYEFDWRISSEGVDLKSATAKVTVAFLNLKATIDDREAPGKKVFGSASFQLASTGFPSDLALEGDAAIFVMPLLCYYLPSESVADGANITIADTAIDKQVHVSGVASMHEGKGTAATVDLNIIFAANGSSTSVEKAPARLTSVSNFNSKSGKLLAADGTITSSVGITKFQIKSR